LCNRLIASIRYNEDYATQKDFIHLISQYSGHQPEFAKISWIFLYKNGKDPSDKTSPGKPLAGYNQIKAALRELYGKESDLLRDLMAFFNQSFDLHHFIPSFQTLILLLED